LYTQKVFKDVTGAGMAPLVKQFAQDEWVWGTGGVPSASWVQLPAQLTDLYERDYIRAWDAILSDLEIVSFSTVEQYAEALGILVAPASSPLRGILRTVVDNTSFVASASDAAPPSVTTRIAEGAKDLFNAAQKKITGTSRAVPGTVITEHFQPIHQVMSGAPPPFDGILDQIRKIREQLLKLGPQAGGASPLRAVTDPTFLDLRRALQTSAESLPAPINTLVAQIAQHVGEGVNADATTELEKRYEEEVVARCRVRIEGRYPFGTGSDVPLGDFAEVFGYGGLYDRFFTERLDPLVDRLQQPWAWRPGFVEPAGGLLAQFQRAERIRQMFFNPGSKTPELGFTVKLSSLDSKATNVYVNIDGQQFGVKPGAESSGPGVWPVPQKRSIAFVVFEDPVAAPEQAIGYEGPWALFRLVDTLKVQAQSDADSISVLRLQTKYHQALATIEAANATSNPFAAGDWRQFKCAP
jgi:type VI secretion system protein ImpL